MGLVFLLRYPTHKEGFENFSNNSCPNLLIKKDNKILLHNTSKATVPGVNPIEFDNLEEYVEFMDWLRSQGLRCPVLFLEEEYDAQNNKGYSVKKDPWSASKNTSKQKYYPANEEKVYVDPSRMQNKLPGFDALDQDIGKENSIDDKFHSDKKVSSFPTDTNWGGMEYTKKEIKKGTFKGSEILKR